MGRNKVRDDETGREPARQRKKVRRKTGSKPKERHELKPELRRKSKERHELRADAKNAGHMVLPKAAPRPKTEPNRVKLTEKFVRSVQPELKPRLYWDTKQGKLALQVHPTGKKVYKLIYRFGSRLRWYKIGNADDISLKTAQRIAQKMMADVSHGIDIQAEKVAGRKAGTFGTLVQDYMEQYARAEQKDPYQTEYKIQKYLLPRLKNKPVKDIARSDIRALFKSISRTAPSSANQALAQARHIFNWAIAEEKVDLQSNPARGIKANKTKSRERYVSDEQIPTLWACFDDCGLVRGSALKMLLLCGQRPGEVCHMRWQDLKLGEHRFVDHNKRESTAHGGWWTLLGEPEGTWPGTKNHQEHRVWLSPLALEILEELAGENDEFVFPGQRGHPITTLDAAMRSICKHMGLADDKRVTPHDLRRTHGTMVTSLGFGRDQMNRIQNHLEGGIGSIYDRHSYADEARRIQEAVCGRISQLIGRDHGHSIVSLEDARQVDSRQTYHTASAALRAAAVQLGQSAEEGLHYEITQLADGRFSYELLQPTSEQTVTPASSH